MKTIKNLFFLTVFSGFVTACDTDIEPITVDESLRTIDTEMLAKTKADLNSGNVSIGVVYGWGKRNEAVLMHTPDLLNVIIVKDGYINMNEHQQKDLADVQSLKKTKVLMGYDFQAQLDAFNLDVKNSHEASIADKEKEWELSSEAISEKQKKEIFAQIKAQLIEVMKDPFFEQMKEDVKQLLYIMKEQHFDGISLTMPKQANAVLSAERLQTLLETITEQTGNGKEKILVIENPLSELAESEQKATWLIYKGKGGANEALEDFTAFAQKWSSNKVFPSVDFTDETLEEGYKDASIFTLSGKNPKTEDILLWNSENRGGIAYYHIEKNYFDISGDDIYKALTLFIAKLKERK